MMINTYEKETPQVNRSEINGKIVRNAAVAREILKRGKKNVWLFDLKPAKEDPQRSVYLFEDTPEFQSIFADVMKDRSEARSMRKNSKLYEEIEELKKQIAELKKEGE